MNTKRIRKEFYRNRAQANACASGDTIKTKEGLCDLQRPSLFESNR